MSSFVALWDGATLEQPLAMVVEQADRPRTEHVRKLHGLVPTQGVELAVFARLRIMVVSRTILTVHTRLNQ